MARSNGGGFWADFQKFLMRGNVVDLAVAVVIGSAFGRIITSLVEDIITPAILDPALKKAKIENLSALTFPNTGIKYGSFLAAVLSFIVIAFALFVIIRILENARKRIFRRGEVVEETVAPDPAIVAQEKLTTALENLTHTIETRRTL